jgi:hypothetical protein
MQMKRYLLSTAAVALMAVCLVTMDSGKVKADSVQVVGPLGPGLIYAAGTEASDSVISLFVRLGTTWYAGVTNISGHLAIVTTGSLSTPPFVVNVGGHNTAFVNTPVLYDGQDAQMTEIFQDWSDDTLDNVTIVITSADYSTVYKVLTGAGSFKGLLSAQP